MRPRLMQPQNTSHNTSLLAHTCCLSIDTCGCRMVSCSGTHLHHSCHRIHHPLGDDGQLLVQLLASFCQLGAHTCLHCCQLLQESICHARQAAHGGRAVVIGPGLSLLGDSRATVCTLACCTDDNTAEHISSPDTVCNMRASKQPTRFTTWLSCVYVHGCDDQQWLQA